MFVPAVNGSTHVSASPADDRAFAWVFHTLVLLERNIFANHARLCVQLQVLEQLWTVYIRGLTWGRKAD